VELQSCLLEALFSALHSNGLGLFDCWVILVTTQLMLANVAMATTECDLLKGKNDICPVMLLW
jgi:hypothetical protein